MINLTLSKELLHFFKRYLAFYNDFYDIESQKYKDISSNIVKSLPLHVKKEEVYFLKSKGLELERDRLLEKAGCSQITFQQLIPLIDAEVQEDLKKVYEELSQVLLNLKDINLRCNKLTQLRLHRVEIELGKINKQPELRKLYNDKARSENVPKSVLSRMI